MKLLLRFFKSFAKVLGILLAFLLIVGVIFVLYVRNVAEVENPVVQALQMDTLQVRKVQDSLTVIGHNWLHQQGEGLYEMYVEGQPYERGVINGRLSQALIVKQEEAFVKQIKHMIPSDRYLGFLKYVIGFVNRDLEAHVLPEYQQEIYGISQASSDSFNWIGSKYFRQLNYHAAHDIGHALQNMMLVGCTSFGTIANNSDSTEMLVGRNFDFWVGDDFAANKIVAFVKPTEGYPFGFITWGAFIGVCSGMNNQGLTVTINAAKSSIPYGAATPVSLVAREILQYARNIEEAIAIANKRKMFVSESFLIASAMDNKVVVIEKTPDTLAIYDTDKDVLTCANHYQSALFANSKLNNEQKKESASVYRQARLEELIAQLSPLNEQKVATILRDTKGLDNADIGWGNEKAINQLIAHHSVIFKPAKLQMWVSTSPWQLGAYICYDLNVVFNDTLSPPDKIAYMYGTQIPADTATINSKGFQNFLAFRAMKMQWIYDKIADKPDMLIALNPNYYDAYRIAGDMYVANKNVIQAQKAYTIALQKEIATVQERQIIENKLKALSERTP